MSLREKYSVTVYVSRLVTTGNKQEFSSVATVKAHKQPLDSSYKEAYEGDWTKAHILYTDVNINIKQGDRLTIEGVVYNVKSFQKYNIGGLQHQKIIIEEKNV